MNRNRLWRHGVLPLFPLALLTGCASTPIAAPPQLVKVTHNQYVPLPAEYLQDCPVPKGEPKTNGELLAQDQEALADLKACNEQLAKARAMNGTVPGQPSSDKN